MAESISRILILTSELIKPPPPIAGLVETTRSLQLAEPKHDEFLGVEMHRLTWANLSYSSGMQHGHCGWIEAEEVEPPSIWPTTLDPIEEGAMTVVQQALPEEVAMAVRDEALTRQRDRPRFNVAPERQVWVWPRPEPLAPRDSDGGEVGQQAWRQGSAGRSWLMYLAGDPRTAVPKV